MDTTLTPRDRERYDTVRACIEGDITNAEAAARLHLTVRQVRRLRRRVEKRGESGVMHGSRGRASNNATDSRVVSAVVAFLKQTKHRDFGPTFAQEKLREQGITLSDESIRAIMTTHDLWKPHARRSAGIHREWRERVALYGELVQFDGSYHDWFENGKEQCLLAAIDDATSAVPRAVFDDNEGVLAVFRFWWRYVEKHGLPVAIYLDKFSTYKVNHKSAVDNNELMTQFERVTKDLGIALIRANSPEAKGRVERLFGTLQDRLVKEMRLRNIKTRDEANRFLDEEYLPDHNARFAVDARRDGDGHRPLTNDLRAKLPAIFSVQSERNVNNDYTIRFKSLWFQLNETQQTTVYKGDTVTIEERLDGTIHVRLKDTYLDYTELPARPERVRMRVTALTWEKQFHKPPVNHPWRKAAAAETERAMLKKLRNTG